MVKTPLTSISIRSKTIKSPTGAISIKSPLGQIFSPSTVHLANKKEEGDLMGNKNFRHNVLEPNGILVADHHMHEDEWSRIAFSLGIPLKQEAKSNVDVSRFAHRVRKRKHFSDSQGVEAISALLRVLSSPFSLSQEDACEFHMDAVPCVEELKNSIHRVPKPSPSISIGYKANSFSHIDDELQKGIIANEHGYPVDLGRVSEPVTGHYWPFLVVEVSEHSIVAAKNACAISASSCANAVRLLTQAAKENNIVSTNNPFNPDTNARYSFSLAICNKIASLNVHEADTQGRYVLKTVTTYSLDEDEEVASLVDRLRSIMVWGRFSRLPEIADKLEALNRKVNGGSPPCHRANYSDEFDPQLLKTLDLRRPKHKKKQAFFHAGMPSWMRNGGIMTA